jgi:hypothetical protein
MTSRSQLLLSGTVGVGTGYVRNIYFFQNRVSLRMKVSIKKRA